MRSLVERALGVALATLAVALAGLVLPFAGAAAPADAADRHAPAVLALLGLLLVAATARWRRPAPGDAPPR